MEFEAESEEIDLKSEAKLDEYHIIPRPQELIKSQIFSSKQKEKFDIAASRLSKLLKEKISKEKLHSKEKKKSLLKAKSLLTSPTLKASSKAKSSQLYVVGAKRNLKKSSTRTEASKITEDDSEKPGYQCSPSREQNKNQVKPLLDVMDMAAFTAWERFEALNARDNFLRLKDAEAKKGESKVKIITGTCPDMCPEKERYSRIAKNCLAVFEMKMAFDSKSSSKDVDHRYMVKEYSRSSADQQEPFPHELRPVSVLKYTMDYLVCNVIDRKNLNIAISEWYDFIWNRTRSIRKDITQQQLCDVECVNILEKCARFHILCAELLSEEDTATFDPKINNENLTKCLQTLKHMYHDLQTKGIQCPNEAEFRAYDILLSLTEGETLRLVKDIRPDVLKSQPVKAAFEAALAFKSNNYVKFFKLMEKRTYLDSCILHRYIHEARVHAMQVIIRAYSVPNSRTMIPLERLVKDLKFESTIDAANFCRWHGLNTDETHVTIQRQTFQKPSSVYPVARATSLVGNKLKTSLGEVINNGPLPQNPLEWYQPRNSFSVDGKLSSVIGVTDDVEEEKEEINEGMDIDRPSTIYPESFDITPSKPVKIDMEQPKSEGKAVFTHLENEPDDVGLMYKIAENSFKKRDSISDFVPSVAKTVEQHDKSTTKNSSCPLLSKSITTTLISKKSPLIPSIETFETGKGSPTLSQPQGTFFGNQFPSKPSSFFSTTVTSSPSGFSFRSPVAVAMSSEKEVRRSNSILHSSSSLKASEINVHVSEQDIVEKANSSSFMKQSEHMHDIIESEDSVEPEISYETDANQKLDDFEEPSCDDDYEERVDNHESLLPPEESNEGSSFPPEITLVDLETLKKIRERKMDEIVLDISDEVYTQCIEGLSSEISQAVMREEWNKKIKLEDSLQKIREILARKTIYKWRLFCERKKQRNMYQNTEPLSPWIPMLMNTEYVASGASSPFSVYKKHCSLSRLTDSKLKEREKRPGWEPLSSSHFELVNNFHIFPPAYLKTAGINRFFKLCIVIASYPGSDLITFIDWMCKKFKFPAFSEDPNKIRHQISSYTLNDGKTLVSVKAIIIDCQTKLVYTSALQGVSAMMLCVPSTFPDSQLFGRFMAQFNVLLNSIPPLSSIPLFTFLLASKQNYNIVQQLTAFLDSHHCKNNFSTLKMNRLSTPSDYISNSSEVICAVNWLIENQQQVPVVLACSFRNYLEDSFASAFNTLFWKLSLQEFKPLFQMPHQIIAFYNKMLKSRANLLCSNSLKEVNESWPPYELHMLYNEYRFVQDHFQEFANELMGSLFLPEFSGDPYSLNDLWHFVKKIADFVDNNNEMLFLSVKSILKNSMHFDWPSIIGKCAYHILCYHYSKFESHLNEDVYYMKSDLDAINFDSFWQTLLLSLKEQDSVIRKRKMSETEEPIEKRIKADTLVDEVPKTAEKAKCVSSASTISDIPGVVSNRVGILLSSLKSALKAQNEESDRFMLKLNESISGNSFFEETIVKKDDKSFKNPELAELLADSLDSKSTKDNETKDIKYPDSLQKALDRSFHRKVSSTSSISEKLLELKYNIQKNNILEDNLSMFLEL